MDYIVHVAVLASIFATLAISLDLVIGRTGLLSVAHAAFYGLGAYSTALFSVRLGLPIYAGVLAGMLLAALVSLVVSLPSLRLRDDYFAIATFGFQLIIYNTFNNWTSLTNGALGVFGIPQPTVFGRVFSSRLDFLGVSLATVALAYWIVQRLSSGPHGRVLSAIRESELLALALGKNTLRFKLVVFAVSAALASVAGATYAVYTSYIDPSSFTVMESILVISMVIIGGPGSSRGVILGAVTLVVLPEILRTIGLPSAVSANLRQIIYGSLLVGMMMFRPRGLLGRYSFGR